MFQVAILSQKEDVLGFLNPDVVDIEEYNEEKGLRQITIKHPLLDREGNDLSRYNRLLAMGNKVWLNETCDGDSCLFVLNDDKHVDHAARMVTVSADEIAVELSDTPPIPLVGYDIYRDGFEDGLLTGRPRGLKTINIHPDGTTSFITTGQISGTRSLKHEGASGNTASFGCGYQGVDFSGVFDVSIKLLTQGGEVDTPYVYIAILRYTSYQNWVRVDTYFDGTNQKVRLIKRVSGTYTTIAEADLHEGKWPVNATYNFRIVKDENHVVVYRVLPNNNKPVKLIEGELTESFTPHLYWGCARDTAAAWDNIELHRVNVLKPITVDETWLSSLYGDYFRIGSVKAGMTLQINGALNLMEIVREIEDQNNVEVVFRYQYNKTTNKIERYMDFLEKKGKTHLKPLELEYNTKNVEWFESEADVRVAAGPHSRVDDDGIESLVQKTKVLQDWNQFSITKGASIPLWVTYDEEGYRQNGPPAYAPFTKIKGTNYVAGIESESSAKYQFNHEKEKGMARMPRVELFETSETDPINIYWLCVKKIREKQHPEIKLTVEPVKLGHEDYFNVGDTVPVKLPGYSQGIESRVVSTTKNFRKPGEDQIEIGNKSTDLFDVLLNMEKEKNVVNRD